MLLLRPPVNRRVRLSSAGGGGGDLYLGYTPTIYAAPADVGSGDGSSEANAMDLATALSTVTAGGIVGLIPGTYTATPVTPSRQNPAWQTTNSGSSGNPIRIVAKYPAALNPSSSSLWAELRSGGAVQANSSPAFGNNGQDYVEWIGLFVDEAVSYSAQDTGPVVLWGSVAGAIKYCRIVGAGGIYASGEMHNGVRIEGGSDVVVSYNYVRNFYQSGGGGNANGSAIAVLECDGGLVERNDIADCAGGFFIKHNDDAPSDWTIRYNKFADLTSSGVRLDAFANVGVTTYSSYVYQNLFINCDWATGWLLSAGDTTVNMHVVNNTIVDCVWGYHAATFEATAAHKFHNNVIYSADYGMSFVQSAASITTAMFSSEHNVYYSGTGVALTGWDSTNTNNSLATWQGLGQDSAAPDSITSDPLFTNYAGGVYTLQGGSPARDLGIDILDLQGGGTSAAIHAGCYVTGSEVMGIA